MQPETTEQRTALATGWEFARDRKWAVLGLSALILIPCAWHRHIEAGDLGSHVYNAWLAQLVDQGEAPGLYIARQWNNILCDVALQHLARWSGFGAAEKIVVGGCVLVFFWGVFALVSAVTGRAPWLLTPCVAILAYGYSFQMGFLNYYLSIGLGCICLALVWRGIAGNWPPLLALGPLVWLAHPLGFLWLVATVAYLSVRRRIPGWWRWALVVTVLAAFAAFHGYLQRRTDITVDWGDIPFYVSNGADQLSVYGDYYRTLLCVAIGVGFACFAPGLLERRKAGLSWKCLALPLELYAVAFFGTALLPENLRVSVYSAWIGLLVSRLTTVSAILGLCVLGCARLLKWQAAMFGVVAIVFFGLLYRDTAMLNRLEANAEVTLSTLPYGTRIIATIQADPSWRIEFIGHVADRACVGRCFVYSNYEPSSGQFRVRARKGSPIVTDSSEDSEDMQSGSYQIQDTDLPLKQLYQCDPGDWTRLCLRDLAEGDDLGAVGRKRR